MEEKPRFEFDINNIKLIDINQIAFNNWNPKLKRSKEFEKVKESLKKNGFLSPIFVREIDDETYKYQVVDGEQRTTAALDLGYKEIPVYNLGEVDEDYAKSLTIWFEQSVPFDKEQLGNLLVELVGKVDLPYTDEEIELMSGVDLITEDDFEDDFEEKSNFVKFNVSMIKEWVDELKASIKQISQDFECSEGVALHYLTTRIKPGEVDAKEIAKLSEEEAEKQF